MSAPTELLRFVATEYLRTRTDTSGFLDRLRELAQERDRLARDAPPTAGSGRSSSEIDRIWTGLERSARASAERMRALELVLAACVTTGAGKQLHVASEQATGEIATEAPKASETSLPGRWRASEPPTTW